MSQILDKFLAIKDKPYQAAEAWKSEHNQPVIGIAPMHFPEELVHAAGMLPIVLRPGDEPITLGNAHMFFVDKVEDLVQHSGLSYK